MLPVLNVLILIVSGRCSSVQRHECASRSVASCWFVISAQTSVHNQVSPSTVPEVRPAPDAFADEPSLFQCSLLGEVLNIGCGLDPVGGRGCKQVVGEEPLRPGSVTVAPEFRQNHDADVPARRCWTGGYRQPAHIPSAAIVLVEGDRQAVGIATEEPVFGEPSARHIRVAEAMPVKGPGSEGIDGEPFKNGQVGLPDGAQVDRRHMAMMPNGLLLSWHSCVSPRRCELTRTLPHRHDRPWCGDETLIESWNGTDWCVVPSPGPRQGHPV